VEEIAKEALRWIHENKGLVIDPVVDKTKDYYSSPRISSELPDCSMPMTFDSYNFCGLGCTFCVTGDTKIATKGKSVPVSSLKVGDIVLSKDTATGGIGPDVVVSVMQKQTQSLLRITLDDGRALDITPEHPVFVTDAGWKNAGDLVEGDDVLVVKKPSLSYRQSIANCMKRVDVQKKMGASLKTAYSSGKLDHLRAKAKAAGTANLVAWNQSTEGRQAVSQRMSENNPMKNADTARVQGATLLKRYAAGELIGHWKGKSHPGMRHRMLTNNPMKDPAIRRSTLQKIVKSWIKNGRCSAGEHKVREALESLGFSFVQQAIVPGPGRDYVLDFMLPDLGVCIEYDGHSRHYTENGVAHDKQRDMWMETEYGVRTLRIHRDQAFIPIEELKGVICKGVSL
jgi:very-short-patch-repair endonuclease